MSPTKKKNHYGDRNAGTSFSKKTLKCNLDHSYLIENFVFLLNLVRLLIHAYQMTLIQYSFQRKTPLFRNYLRFLFKENNYHKYRIFNIFIIFNHLKIIIIILCTLTASKYKQFATSSSCVKIESSKCSPACTFTYR